MSEATENAKSDRGHPKLPPRPLTPDERRALSDWLWQAQRHEISPSDAWIGAGSTLLVSAIRLLAEEATARREPAALGPGWPPGAEGREPDALAAIYDEAYKGAAREGQTPGACHEAGCQAVAGYGASQPRGAYELAQKTANRRGAQLAHLVSRILETNELRPASLGKCAYAHVQPTDVVEIRGALYYVEAVAPAFHDPAPDFRESWRLETLPLDRRPGHPESCSLGGSGDDRIEVTRILHAIDGWICPSCYVTNRGDECNGCGTVKRRSEGRAFYAEKNAP